MAAATKPTLLEELQVWLLFSHCLLVIIVASVARRLPGSRTAA